MKKSTFQQRQQDLIDPAEAYHAQRRHGGAPNNRPSMISASINTNSNTAGGRYTFDPATSMSNATPGNQVISPNSSNNFHQMGEKIGSENQLGSLIDIQPKKLHSINSNNNNNVPPSSSDAYTNRKMNNSKINVKALNAQNQVSSAAPQELSPRLQQ